MRRRALIKSGILAASLAALPRYALPQPPGPRPNAGPATEPLGDGLILVRGEANGLVYERAGQNLLIDVPAPEFEGSAELYGPEPILVNSNWRPEHTAANAFLGPAGTEIIAHENTKLWMGNDFTVAWESRRYRPRPAEVLPNTTFYTSTTLEIGDETVEIGHTPRAHTDGDIYVYFRRANVLFASDLLAVDGYPILDYATGGWIRGMIDATERLFEIADETTLIVPAVGEPGRRDALEAQLALCRATDEAVGKAYTTAKSLDEVLAMDPLAAYRSE
ncbi:MAG: hypothetical protein R3305_06630, partial [Gammaproteobacteria bacterium]|nr:hypothetical protein [Gammaproteobacteria bacterium]